MRKIDEVKQAITDEIISLLESVNTKDWDKGWIPALDSWAENPQSGTVYRGMNQLYLSLIYHKRSYSVNRWLTFNQVNELKGTIRKGSKGTFVVYFSIKHPDTVTPTEKEQSTDRPAMILKYYHVFNVCDIEGLPQAFYQAPEPPIIQEWEKDQQAENIIDATGAKINYVVGDKACYNRQTDEITLPDRKQFNGQVPFYSVAFHELAHWTGAPDRLNREKGKNFGDTQYAFEELVAELSAAFLCGSLGYTMGITRNSQYIKGWLQALKNEKDFIFKASAYAQKASEFIQEKAGILNVAIAE